MEFILDPSIFDVSVPLSLLWTFLYWGGWIIVVGFILRVAVDLLWKLYMDEIQGNYVESIERMTLAIQVPKQTEQTPKAVENIFAHLSGLYAGKGNMVDRYIKGKVQENFSCEIVSRNGSIQFIVNTPIKFRDVVEAAIFAQYPDAEIKQVPDYAIEVPQKYPDEQYDLWGTELALVKPDAYPIKTSAAFEHTLPGSFKDPIASMLEFLGTLQPTEQVWIQFVLMPVDDEWQKESDKEAKKLIGAKAPPPKKSLLQELLDLFSSIIQTIIGLFLPGGTPKTVPVTKQEAPNQMQYLSPGERLVVEQVQIKASKPGFASKIRFVYVAPKEIFNKGKIAAGVIGAFKQFSASNLNGFKPESLSKVGAGYFRVEKITAQKQTKLMNAYVKRRSGSGANAFGWRPSGGKPYMLNTEELATLWHFPMIETKAPLIHKSEFKKVEPPPLLPMREARMRSIPKKKPESPPAPSIEDGAPSNLPFA